MATPSLSHRILFVLLGLLTASMAFAQENGTRSIKDIEQTDPTASGVHRALIIGISKYKHVKQLQYAGDDALMMRDYLKNNPAISMPDNNITLLLDSLATRGRIFTELKKVIDVSKTGDEVLIYFAGHGDVETEIESGFLLGYDCEASNYPASDAVDISMLEKYVNALVKKQVKVMLIVDACHAGNLAGGKMGAQTTLNSLSQLFNNVAKVLSCKPGELSEEKSFGSKGHGIFTYYLVNGMSGMADENNDNTVTQDELETYISSNVKKETAGRQHPRIEGTMADVKVDQGAKVAAAKQMENGSHGGGSEAVASRGIGDDFIATLDPDSKVLYDKFKDHVKNDKLNGKGDDHAYGDYLAAKKQGKSYELLNYMSYELQADLEDATQEWLNYYLRGQLEKYTSWKFDSYDDAADKLTIVLSLLDKSDFRYTTIEANKLFFQSIPVFIAKDKKDFPKGLAYLLKADSLAPNQPHILSVIGMFYDQGLKPDYEKAKQYYEKTIALSPKWVYPYVSMGALYYAQKDYEKAIESYKKGIEIDKNNANALYNLGLVYMYKKNPEKEKALEYFHLTIKADSAMFNPYLTIGKDYLDHKDYSNAMAYFKKAIKLAPHKPAPYNQMAGLYLAKKDYPNALDYYGKAVEQDSMFTDGYYNSGLIYVVQKKPELAETLYKKVIEIDPSYKDAYVSIGELRVGEKKYDEGLEWYKKALAIDSNYSGAYNDIGIMYRKKKEYKKALEYYAKTSMLDSTNADGYNNSANIFSDEKDYGKAIEYYRKAIKVDSTSTKYFNNLGIVYNTLKKYDDAIYYYRKAINLDSTNSDAYYNLGSVENALEHYGDALNLYQASLIFGGDSADIYYKIGKTFQNMDRKDDAQKMYALALEIDPKHTSSLLEVGSYYYAKDSYDTAIYYYQRDIAVDSESKEGYYDLGLSYRYGKKDLDKARPYFERAISLDSTYTSPWLRIGELYANNKDYDKAIATFNKVMKMDKSKTAEAIGDIAWVYELQEDYPKAIDYYQKAFKADTTVIAYQNKVGYLYNNNLGKKMKAIEEYENTLKKYPNNATALQAIASIYMDTLMYDKALAYYARSMKYDTANIDAWVYTGYLYTTVPNNDSAMYCYNRALQINPDYGWAHVNLGYVYNAKGEYAEARRHFKISYDQDTTSYFSALAMGISYAGEENWAEAKKYYDKAIQLKPEKMNAYQNMGAMYYAAKKFTEARQYYLKALAVDTNDYDITMMVGVSCQYEGDTAAAVRYLQKAINMKPDLTGAYYNLACHYSLANDVPNTLKTLETCFKLGYKEFDHMEKDTDMDNVRNLDSYKELLRKNGWKK